MGDMMRLGVGALWVEPKEGIMGESVREGGVEIMPLSGMTRGGPAPAEDAEDMLGRGGTEGGLSTSGGCGCVCWAEKLTGEGGVWRTGLVDDGREGGANMPGCGRDGRGGCVVVRWPLTGES